jgi:hypothetical protein
LVCFETILCEHHYVHAISFWFLFIHEGFNSSCVCLLLTFTNYCLGKSLNDYRCILLVLNMHTLRQGNLLLLMVLSCGILMEKK